MKKRSLWLYIIGVIVVLVIINVIVYMVGGTDKLKIEIFSAGYLVGMTAMYIAVHIYRWK